MKFIVDEMPYFRYDCPFHDKDKDGDDVCKCGENTYDCEYFRRGHDHELCNWLKEIEAV